MDPNLSRRVFVHAIGAGVAVAACSRKTSSTNATAPVGASSDTVSKALGPPKEGDVKLPAGATMPKRALGKTGESVSAIGLGGYHIGIPKDEAEGIRIVHRAIDSGVTFLDNCWDYNEGASEERMGKALADGKRAKVFLMTKIDGRTAKAAAAQIDQSLARMKTDVIDLMQIHEVIRMDDAERVFAEGGAIEALEAARKAGKIRFIGFTGHKDPKMHLRMLKVADEHGFHFDAVQMPLNPMDAHYRSFEKEVLPVLVEKGIGVLGMKPLGSGNIMKSGAVTARECLHYALGLPTSVVITGCESVGVLEQALEAAYAFRPMDAGKVAELLGRTKELAKDGKYEAHKSTTEHDGTTQHPQWLTEARL
jgi:aryl-alcohol dehydrogenase-like predicted oxidoreductase